MTYNSHHQRQAYRLTTSYTEHNERSQMSASERAKKRAEKSMVLAESYHPEYDSGPTIAELESIQNASLRELADQQSQRRAIDSREAAKLGLTLDAYMRKKLRAQFSRLKQEQDSADRAGSFIERLIALRKASADDLLDGLSVDGIWVKAISLEQIGATIKRKLPDGSEIETISDGSEVKIVTTVAELEELLEQDGKLRKPYRYATGTSKQVLYSILDQHNTLRLLTE